MAQLKTLAQVIFPGAEGCSWRVTVHAQSQLQLTLEELWNVTVGHECINKDLDVLKHHTAAGLPTKTAQYLKRTIRTISVPKIGNRCWMVADGHNLCRRNAAKNSVRNVVSRYRNQIEDHWRNSLPFLGCLVKSVSDLVLLSRVLSSETHTTKASARGDAGYRHRLRAVRTTFPFIHGAVDFYTAMNSWALTNKRILAGNLFCNDKCIMDSMGHVFKHLFDCRDRDHAGEVHCYALLWHDGTSVCRRSFWSGKICVVDPKRKLLFSTGRSPIISYADTVFGHRPTLEFLRERARQIDSVLSHVGIVGPSAKVLFSRVLLLADHSDHNEDTGNLWRWGPTGSQALLGSPRQGKQHSRSDLLRSQGKAPFPCG